MTEEKVLKSKDAYELYKEGAGRWNDWAKNHHGWKVDFSKWDFQTEERVIFADFVFPGAVSFREALFPKGAVYFMNAVFTDGDVDFTDAKFGNGDVEFTGAKFGDGIVTFERAEFSGTRLIFRSTQFANGRIDFTGAYFCKDFFFNFNNAKSPTRELFIRDINIEDARSSRMNFGMFKLADESLDGIDLRSAYNFRLNGNSIVGTRFSPNSNDPYSILRRKYTGAKFTLVLLFTVVTFLPFVSKAITFSILGDGQELVISSGLLNRDEVEQIRSATKATNTLSIVSGWTSENREAAVTISVLIFLYNLLRGWVTLSMVALREAEERSQHAPTVSDYWRYYLIHTWFLQWVFYGILIITTFRIYQILAQEVLIPIAGI